MRRTILALLLLSVSIACKMERGPIQKKEYPRMVGDITKDSLIDDPGFKACDSLERAAQYFHKTKSFAYTGEKASLVKVFKENYKPLKKDDQNGWIRIRFMVNCEGRSGRFRMIQANFDYEQFQFDHSITNQLMSITRSLEGWEIASNEKFSYDYYQYLIFKIENGELIEILP